MAVSKKAPAKPAPKAAAKKATTSKAPNPAPVSAMDKKWQAEDDARTLMRAEEIKADKGRLGKAKSVAAQQAKAAARIGKL